MAEVDDTVDAIEVYPANTFGCDSVRPLAFEARLDGNAPMDRPEELFLVATADLFSLPTVRAADYSLGGSAFGAFPSRDPGDYTLALSADSRARSRWRWRSMSVALAM